MTSQWRDDDVIRWRFVGVVHCGCGSRCREEFARERWSSRRRPDGTACARARWVYFWGVLLRSIQTDFVMYVGPVDSSVHRTTIKRLQRLTERREMLWLHLSALRLKSEFTCQYSIDYFPPALFGGSCEPNRGRHKSAELAIKHC